MPAAQKTKRTKKRPASVKATKAKQPAPINTNRDYVAKLKWVGKWLALPALFYFVFFVFYSWPWMAHFNTHFFLDQGDGFQNVWNVWWINKAVTQLHVSPWQTSFLHYPYGTTLIAQTLNPFNGFVAIFLIHILRMSLVQAVNTMITFSFVFGGVTTFWLCHFFSRKYIPSLIGGFFFTFSSYHFAHAVGHMQLVSLEWIPLFILLWWKLLATPRYRYAVGAAITLLLVLFCDYYYFLYCVSGGGLILIYLWHTKQLAPWRAKSSYRPWIVFLALAFIMVLPLPLALLRENSRDPLQGGHDELIFSTSILSPFIDGASWRFASLTHWYWKNVKAYTPESSVYFGISTLVLIGIAFWKRNKLNRHVVFWITFGLIFAVLSLGPRVLIGDITIHHAVLPYAVFEHILPQLKLSGDPVRFIALAFLAAAVLSAIVLSKLNLAERKGKIIMALFFAVLFVELWPGMMPLNIASMYPSYVNALAKLPAGAVVDNAAVSASWQLYDQTITNKPIVLGYISRTPTSVAVKDAYLTDTILRGDYAKLCSQYKVRYFTTPAYRPLKTNLPIIYNDHKNLIYDLKDSPNC